MILPMQKKWPGVKCSKFQANWLTSIFGLFEKLKTELNPLRLGVIKGDEIVNLDTDLHGGDSNKKKYLKLCQEGNQMTQSIEHKTVTFSRCQELLNKKKVTQIELCANFQEKCLISARIS